MAQDRPLRMASAVRGASQPHKATIDVSALTKGTTMRQDLSLAAEFVRSLQPASSGQSAIRGDLLADGVLLEALAKTAGKDNVIARLTDERSRNLFRELAFAEPEPFEAAVKITGNRTGTPAPSGIIFVLHVADGKIHHIQQQAFGSYSMPAGAMHLSDKLKNLINTALQNRTPMLVSYVDGHGRPVLSFRGSVQTFDDDSLAMWIRNPLGDFVQSIAERPNVGLMYRNEATKETFHFQGRARISETGADRDRVYSSAAEIERQHDFVRRGVAVIVELDLVEGWFGLTPDGPVDRVRMVRNN
jgi:hypothetical protein